MRISSETMAAAASGCSASHDGAGDRHAPLLRRSQGRPSHLQKSQSEHPEAAGLQPRRRPAGRALPLPVPSCGQPRLPCPLLVALYVCTCYSTRHVKAVPCWPATQQEQGPTRSVTVPHVPQRSRSEAAQRGRRGVLLLISFHVPHGGIRRREFIEQSDDVLRT